MAAALADGSRQRATSATAMNAASSRSHAVLSVRVSAAGGAASLLHLVDLAGESHSCFFSSMGTLMHSAQWTLRMVRQSTAFWRPGLTQQ